MAPKAAPKAAKKPVVPLEEPADKRVAPDLSSVLNELHSSDAETQQQGLSRLLGIREYAGAKVRDVCAALCSFLSLHISDVLKAYHHAERC